MNTAVERPYAGLSRAPILLRARVRLRGLALQLTADDGGVLWTQGRPLRAQERECVCVISERKHRHRSLSLRAHLDAVVPAELVGLGGADYDRLEPLPVLLRARRASERRLEVVDEVACHRGLLKDG